LVVVPTTHGGGGGDSLSVVVVVMNRFQKLGLVTNTNRLGVLIP
jgi:hypothetical protein